MKRIVLAAVVVIAFASCTKNTQSDDSSPPPPKPQPPATTTQTQPAQPPGTTQPPLPPTQSTSTNAVCTPTPTTTSVSFASVQTALTNNCARCHNGTAWMQNEAGFKANLSNIQSRVTSGNMPKIDPAIVPQPQPMSAADKAAILGYGVTGTNQQTAQVAFNQDVQPLLQKRCADQCHGASIVDYTNVKTYFTRIMDQIQTQRMPIDRSVYWALPTTGTKKADPLSVQEYQLLNSWAQQGFAQCR